MARNRVIGKNNRLPWKFPEDLKHFKELTVGSTVIMGRKTFEGIGKALPHRENFVLSRAVHDAPEGVSYFDSLDKALKSVKTDKAFVIGGADVYAQSLSKVNGVFMTYIDADYEGDVTYPEIPSSFDEKSRRTLSQDPLLEVIYYENTLNSKQAK